MLLIVSILILLSATAKAYDEKVSCRVSVNEEYGKTCRLENVNLETTRRLQVEIDTKSLKYVYFQSSEIESFTKEFVEQLRGVEYLNANGVGLERVDGMSLRILNELLVFWAGSNEIKSLEANVFSGNRKLEAIYLKFNQINFIDSAAFQDLDTLQVLDLSSNKIKTVRAVFDSLNALIKLDLSSNLIERIHGDAFRNLKALKELNLEKNKLKWMDPQPFEPLSSLEHINISFNKSPLKLIPGNFLQTNRRLKKILLISNGIEAIDEKFINNAKPSLQLLSLRNNVCVDADVLEIEQISKCK